MEYGFIKTCEALQRDVHNQIVLCWEGGSWRRSVDADYKANRGRSIEPDRIKNFKQFINMVYDHAEKPGLEADDIIASLAKNCFIFTNDKDMLQLVSEDVVVIKSHKDQKFPWDVDRVMEKYHGLRPDQLPKFFAFVGDSIDNIPGSGVRASVLARVMQTTSSWLEFRTHPLWRGYELDAIADWLDSGRYELNLKLVTLKREAVEIQPAQWDEVAVEEWLRMMEFHSLGISRKVKLVASEEF
jgi:5'-3' exonuclease